MKNSLWVLWLVVVFAVGGYYAFTLFFAEDKSALLIGEATHGHYQIELACESCHTDAFGGQEVLQQACEGCHAEDLEAAHDSHPTKKFTDPRNADRLDILDARYCVACHTEHQQEQTHSMGVTLPDDYCFHCHVDIGEERESHKDLAFDSCASAGCHNFHDNRALYESFLVENANQQWLLAIAMLPKPNKAHLSSKHEALSISDTNAPPHIANTDIEHEWSVSSHAQAGINCMDCHSNDTSDEWIEKPSIAQCATCHESETKTFTEGKHGMRLAHKVSQKLPAISPSDSHMPFLESANEKHQSCTACHDAHSFEREEAAVAACLGCHNDEHSLAFEASPHGQLWFEAIKTQSDTSTLVSCASCHMPRTLEGKGENQIVGINHNQNVNLRPNEKMIRTVCMNCHGLGFAIDSLADDELIRNNFSGKPTLEIPSIEWALKREQE